MKYIPIVVTAIALLFLGYVTGAVTTRFELFPFQLIKDPLTAAEALFAQRSGKQRGQRLLGAKPARPDDFASPPLRSDAIGVVSHNEMLAFAGPTIYTAVNSRYPVRAMDMQGNTLHQWELPLADLEGPRDDGLALSLGNLSIASQRVDPETGDMLLVLGTALHTPWGIGIISIDKNSKLRWKYMKQAHHDLDVGGDGNIYAMLHKTVYEPWPGLENIEVPFVDDQVVVLSPDGKELQQVSVLAAIQNSDYLSMLQFADTDIGGGDLIHANSITWLSADMARNIPNAAAGDILLSLRNIDVLAVLDIEANTIKWAVRGPWRMQHDPDVLANGNILLYDNRGDLKNGGTTRILEIDPLTLEIQWEYPGDQDVYLYSSIFGSQQRLPNGNTLIAESNNGRLLEVSHQGEIVWDYLIPERHRSNKGWDVGTVVFADRFAPDELKFLERP